MLLTEAYNTPFLIVVDNAATHTTIGAMSEDVPALCRYRPSNCRTREKLNPIKRNLCRRHSTPPLYDDRWESLSAVEQENNIDISSTIKPIKSWLALTPRSPRRDRVGFDNSPRKPKRSSGNFYKEIDSAQLLSQILGDSIQLAGDADGHFQKE